MEPLYIIKEEEATLHISKGNSKVGKGIYTWSTLPGNRKNLLVLNKTVVLTSIPGTCSKHCEGCFNGGCYAVNSAKLHHNVVIKAWGDNTLLLRSGRAFGMIDEFISKKNRRYLKTGDRENHAVVKTFRINVSGEIESAAELERWNELAKKHPEVNFGLYTKNYEALEEFMEKHGDTADNFCINVSEWHGVAKEFLARHPGRFNVFEYDDSNRKSCGMSPEDIERLSKTVHCPAVTRAGKHAKGPNGEEITCDHCGKCYRKTGLRTAVWAH